MNNTHNKSQSNKLGQSYKIIGLTSEKGQLLNSKIGKIIGFENDRYHVKIEGDQTIYKIKLQNLIKQPITTPTQIPKPKPKQQQKQTQQQKRIKKLPCMPIDKPNITRCLKLVQKYYKIPNQLDDYRKDVTYRVGKVKQHYNQFLKGNYSHELKCCDLGNIDFKKQKDQIYKMLNNNKPKCSGDGKFRITDLYLGLISPNNTNKNIYSNEDNDQQAIIRLREYQLSGLCVYCQIAIYQNPANDI